jgi:hypothetical protein
LHLTGALHLSATNINSKAEPRTKITIELEIPTLPKRREGWATPQNKTSAAKAVFLALLAGTVDSLLFRAQS